MDDKQRQNLIRIASTLTWAIGIIFALILPVVMVSAAAITKGRVFNGLSVFIFLTVVSVLYCSLGWGLRRLAKWAGIMAVVVSGISLFFSAIGMFNNVRNIIGLVINGLIFIFVILGWKVLK